MFLQIPDIGDFTAGLQPGWLALHHPRTHPVSDPCQPHGPSSRQGAQGLPVLPGDWEGENASCLGGGCAPPPSLLPTAEPGSAWPQPRCSRFLGFCDMPSTVMLCWHHLKHPLYSNTEVTLDDLMPVLSSINR